MQWQTIAEGKGKDRWERRNCSNEARRVRVFFWLVQALHLGKLPTDCLQATDKKKARYLFSSGLSLFYMGWLMGLEPTTTGITILDSTN